MDDKRVPEPPAGRWQSLRTGWAFYLWVALVAVWLVSTGIAIVAGTTVGSLEAATVAVLVSTVTFGLVIVWSVVLFVLTAIRASSALDESDRPNG